MMNKEKEIEGLTKALTSIFKILKKEGVAIEKAEVIELEPLKPIEEEFNS